jgi:hypothetical protein
MVEMNIYRKKARRKKIKVLPEVIAPEKQILFDELCEVCTKLDVEIRIEPGRFEGSECIIEGGQFIYLNKNSSIDSQIDILSSYLKSINFDEIYLSPKIRSHLKKDEFIIEE